MSQNPEHTPRRALSPPAVTRFQLRTASATEAVFSPPYVPAARDPSRPASPPPAKDLTPEPFPEPPARPELPALPPRAITRELPRPTPPTRALELPPRRESEPARPDTDRTEPGTWREIIARFERELGPVTDYQDDADVEATGETEAPEVRPRTTPEPGTPETGTSESTTPESTTPGKWRAPFDIDAAGAPEPAEADAAGIAASERAEPAPDTEPVQAGPDTDTEPVKDEPGADAEPTKPLPGTGPEPVQPGEPPLLDEPVAWEIGAMTTADYSPPPSIHDAEHDSWPVDTDDGEAVPAWSEDVDDTADLQDADVFGEIGELLLDQVAPADPWDREPEQETEPQPRSEFPLDAFIVPAGVQNVSGYRDADVAQRVAHRLDELARQLRDGGFSSLGSTATVDELSRVLAAVVTGYVARGG